MIDEQLLPTLSTPCYYYDVALLRKTIETALAARPSEQYHIHYAIKANDNPALLAIIASYGLGADCVSMGEVKEALRAGIPADKIVYAGVGKRDDEIRFAIEQGIKCLNVESIEELEIINEIAQQMGRIANVTLRVNPDIDAHTHSYITTGLEENKFGIDRRMLDQAINVCLSSKNINLIGLHFHIGSQILSLDPIKLLCERINSIAAHCKELGADLQVINVGGGLGVDYENPDEHPIANFKGFFETLKENLHLAPGQECLCEPGRALVAQCGSLIAKVLYVKKGIGRKFVILDAGMNDLIRPALYGAHHLIQNLSSKSPEMEKYDVVGPICESDDIFGKDELLPVTHRGDYFAIRTAGAYGETMSSTYNHRELPATCLQ